MHRHRVLSELSADAVLVGVRVVSNCFWHNSGCSGYLPFRRKMKFLGPTSQPRLNEAAGFVFLAIALFFLISLISYHPLDPSLNTSTSSPKVANLAGPAGSYLSDFLLQSFGIAAYLI